MGISLVRLEANFTGQETFLVRQKIKYVVIYLRERERDLFGPQMIYMYKLKLCKITYLFLGE